MYKIKKIARILILMVIILILNFLNFANSVRASNFNTADLKTTGDCGSLLKYKGVEVITNYVEYEYDGKKYPAYCLDKTKTGADVNGYSVSVEDAIQDVMLWKIIINGYPYKTIEELGVANKEEAFSATKQAVYTYVHGNQLSDYTPIGEAGQRTLNAMYKIVNSANQSTEVQISNQVDINKLNENWIQDEIDPNYVYKKYNVSSKANIDNYKVNLTDENGQRIEDIKITDENNNEKQEFTAKESFKILIPIKSMTSDKNIKIHIETKVETKPILYGRAPSSNLQDYALTGVTYEDGTGDANDFYTENKTKLVIIKQNKETKEKLQGVEFQLLDSNKNVIYTNLKTDENGKIEVNNLIPGKYYIKETRTIDGYEMYEDLIELDIELNEEITITVNNNKEEKPVVEYTKDSQEFTQENVQEPLKERILPVTGM